MPISRKRPWLFRNSNRIFESRTVKNGLVELFIKAFFRNSSQIFSYLQIIGVSVTAIIILPPIWMKWLMYVLFLLIMKKWLDSIWSIVTSKPLLVALSPEEDGMFSAQKQVLKLFLAPAYILVGLIATLATMVAYIF